MVSGIRNTVLGLAAAAALVGMADSKQLEHARRIGVDPERGRPSDHERQRHQRDQEARAWDRRRRLQRESEEREQRLRQRIAAGKDDRPDKYLHAAARRRREAARAASLAPATETSGA